MLGVAMTFDSPSLFLVFLFLLFIFDIFRASSQGGHL